MGVFSEDPEKKAARLAKQKERIDRMNAKLDGRRAHLADKREALGLTTKRKVEPGELDAERFRIDVTENLTGRGARLGHVGSAGLAAYRVVVTDIETGIPQYVAQGFSYKNAHALGRMYVAKLVTGKRKLK